MPTYMVTGATGSSINITKNTTKCNWHWMLDLYLEMKPPPLTINHGQANEYS